MSKKPKLSKESVMVESDSSVNVDETDLLALICILFASWRKIVSSIIICTGLAFAYALIVPESFKAEVLLAPVQVEKSGASNALSQFGGLAAFAGISIPSNSDVEQVLATLTSRKFLQVFIEKNKLQPILSSKEDLLTNHDAISLFKSTLSVAEDKKTGLITLSISWKEPILAAQWANDLVKQLNEQLREQAIADSKKRVGYLEQELTKTSLQDMRAVLYNLLESEKQKAMLANVNEDFALEVIDPAFAPKSREKPNRKLIVALGGVCGGFLGIFAVFFPQFLQKLNSTNSESVIQS
jgi:uncharacterized protein involved in exopolysaccharide biosynthesis